GGAGALRGRAFAHVLRHAPECALVNFAFGCAAEWQAGMLQLDDGSRCFARQIFDRVLVPEPVRPFDRVVHVPLPVIGAHVAEARGDSALCGHGMAAGWEDLGNARRFQPRAGCAHRCAQARPAGAHDDHVISMIDDLIGAHATPPNAIRPSANRANAAPPTARNNSKVLMTKLRPGSWT